MNDVDPREQPRTTFDPLICATYCRRGRDIPFEKIEASVAKALDRSKGRLAAPVLKPIRKHFDQYMLLPAKSNDPFYRKLEKIPDPRSVAAVDETDLVEQLYGTIKQDFSVSLILRFCNPRDFGMISQPIRKAARWLGIRVEEKRADLEYVALTRAFRKLRDELGIERVADLDQGLYSLYFQCLVGEGRRCTNFDALRTDRRNRALRTLANAAGKAAELRRLFDEAQEQMESLDDAGRDDFLNHLLQAVTEFGAEFTEQLETDKRRFFESRAKDIGRSAKQLVESYPAVTHLSDESRQLLAGAQLMWRDLKQGAGPLPGMIAVACGQAFEHELRDRVFASLGVCPAPDGAGWSWLKENEPLLARHSEADRVWRVVLDQWKRGPKFELLIGLVRLVADPALKDSPLMQQFSTALFASFPSLKLAETPVAYGPARFAADIDSLRELRNKCVHQADAGKRLGPKAAELVFATPEGILARLSG